MAESTPRHFAARPRMSWSWLFALVPVIAVVVGGWAHRWVTEDAFIDFRVIHNLWSGYGPVYNPGERVEAYTDPLWVFVLAAIGGVFRFVSLEWWSVVLGLLGTASGFWFGGRAAQRLAASLGSRPVLPLGLLVAASVDGVWDFATSGLETGMAISWEGVSWWLLVRCALDRRGFKTTAFVLGLGELIRPDLGLFSVAYLVALGVIIARSDGQARQGWIQRWLVPAVCAGVLPVAYELFRMAYFGLLVPNTALAKSSSSVWWSQGYTYFRDFYTSDHLVWVMVPVVLIVVLRAAEVGRTRDWVVMAVFAAPLAGAVLDCAYVVRVGGDYMHARFMIPSFFAVSMVTWLAAPRLADLRWLPVGALSLFALACGVHFRYPDITVIPPDGITNERLIWVSAADNAHPISLGAYRLTDEGETGVAMAKLASTVPAGSYDVVGPNGPIRVKGSVPGGGPEKVVVPFNVIGIFGLNAGPKVFIYDTVSIANPIGSHIALTHRGRPGNEKNIGDDWMMARFAPPGTPIPASVGTPSDIAAARAAISCVPLTSYLHGITTSLGAHQILSNLVHAYSYTKMTFSVVPATAGGELCGR
jgi:arabinofuranosyltransferase